jgi:carbonic anhydrase
MKKIDTPSDFTFFDLAIDSLSIQYISNMIKIVGNFGSLIDSEMIEYECRELRIHTPSEHRIDGLIYDMEV